MNSNLHKEARQEAAVALGQRLRSIRTARGQGLREVAALTDLTVSFLSRLENGLTEVTVDASPARRFLGLTIGELFVEEFVLVKHRHPLGALPRLKHFIRSCFLK